MGGGIRTRWAVGSIPDGLRDPNQTGGGLLYEDLPPLTTLAC